MRFQYVHSLTTTGQMNTSTWQTLTNAVIERQTDPTSYDYVYVSEKQPESVTLYQNGKKIFSTLANTGITAAPTENGTYPVYLRFTVTTMSGTLPDGQTYDDTGIPWVSYFHGGDALHGFIRSSYGYPQSLGCVEMPFADAAVLWPHTPIGTLVSVQ
jgi:lipoprotein-anchoring transpeptidase ErfK/SrfK